MIDSSIAISKRNSKANSRRSSEIIGVEIGYSNIYVVRLKKNADKGIFMEDHGTFGFDPSLELESPEFGSILKAALKRVCGSSKEIPIWAAPRIDRARLHHIKVPKVASSKLAGAVYWWLQREDSFLEDETVFDFQIEEEEEGVELLEVTGALVKREDVEEVQKAFSHAGYRLSGIGLPLTALHYLVKLQEKAKGANPVLIGQLGQLSTSVSVLFGGRLVFTRIIPLGLQSLAEALAKGGESELSQEEACEMVLSLGREGSDFSSDEREAQERAFDLVRPVLDRMARQIELTIGYYQSNFDSEPMEKVFLGGEIAGRGRLFDFLSGQLSLEVIPIDPFDAPSLEVKGALPGNKASQIAYGPAFGLALEGCQSGINLANTYKDRQSEGEHNKLATLVSIVLLLLAGAAALFYNTQRIKLGGLEEQEDKLERSLRALGPELSEAVINEMNEEVRLLNKRQRTATKRYEGLALLSEVTRLTPENISLLHVSAAMGSSVSLSDTSGEDAKGRLIKTAADRKGTLFLKGVVSGVRTSLETSLTIYIARLDQSRLISTVEVDSTELVQSSGNLYLTFSLEVETIEETADTTKN